MDRETVGVIINDLKVAMPGYALADFVEVPAPC